MSAAIMLHGVRAYRPGDAALIEARPHQRLEAGIVRAGADAAARLGPAITVVRDGAPVACGGFTPNPERADAADGWAFIGLHAGAAGLAVARGARRLLQASSFSLVEASVRVDFPIAIKFIHWLGFRVEGRLAAWGPDGADYWLYAWRRDVWRGGRA